MKNGIEKADRELYFFNKKIRFSVLNPLNVEQEMRKVMKDSSYNPQLKYQQPLPTFHEIKGKLVSLEVDDSIMGKLLHYRRNEFLKMVLMLENVGKDKFTSSSLNLYGKPSPDLVKKAYRLLNKESEEKEAQYSGISVVKKFLDSLLCQGLRWQVKEKDMVAGAAFDVGRRVLLINPKRRFSDTDLKRLIVHEIGTHIIRAENGTHHRHKLFLIGFPHYLPTEEGLAVYNEERAGLLSNNLLKTYAARVVAVDLALHSSFTMVYTALREFFPPEDAFTLALRAKRGLANTANPGALTKDYYYLKGYEDMKRYVAQGGSLAPLYTGKVGIEHVPFLRYLD